MVDNEIVILREIHNSGDVIYAYKMVSIGIYVSYGLSAFHAVHYIHAVTSYSNDYLLPVAIFKEYEFMTLLKTMVKRDYTGNLWTFHMPQHIDNNGYDIWLAKVKDQREIVISQNFKC